MYNISKNTELWTKMEGQAMFFSQKMPEFLYKAS